MKRFAWIILGCLLLPVANAAGFDCGKASTDIEKMICNTPELLWDDRSLNALYRLARALNPTQKPKVVVEQKQWLGQTRDDCKTVECLLGAYQSRSSALKEYINKFADPIPTSSKWEMHYAPQPNPNPEECSDSFEVDFVRLASRQVIGVWEASTFCHGFINGGMVDIHEDGRIFDVRVLGGRGPSYQVGVALIARKESRLYIANMFERSSVGSQGDTEFFGDVVLTGGPTDQKIVTNDYGNTTVGSLESAWLETEKAAIKKGICAADKNLNVCIRRVR